MEILIYIIFPIGTIILISLGFWNSLKSERDKVVELERAIYLADEKTHFIKIIEPEHFVPTRHFNTYMIEKHSSYDECRIYEILNEASRNGKYQKN